MNTMPLLSRPDETPTRGLTSKEVHQRRSIHGFNVLTPPPQEPWWRLYLEKYEDPVIRILIVAAFIAIVVGAFDGHYAEGVGIVIAILLATTLAFLNEYKAGQEFALLSHVNDDVSVSVIRDGTVTTVARRALVPDDIVLVEKGDEVPADGALLEAVALEVDESQLTGESDAVLKNPPGTLAASSAERAYPTDHVYRGTMVVEGHGTVRIDAIGDKTEIGKTARQAAEETDEQTPLNRQLERLSKLIGVVGTGMALLTFLALVVRGVVSGELLLRTEQWLVVISAGVGVAIATVRVWLPIVYDGFALAGRTADPPNWLEREGLGEWVKVLVLGAATAGVGMFVTSRIAPLGGAGIPGPVAAELLTYFMIAVTIIVVAVPEGLAMSVTLSLAYSMRKMTATNNLVRRMHACETIGAATVICSDKTGTLTMNEMRVNAMSLPWLGDASLAHELTTPIGALFAEALAGNSTAHLDRSEDAPRPVGNPTEGALLLWLHDAGVDYRLNRGLFHVTRQWTFSTDRKFMATLGASSVHDGEVLHVKGAPEIVLERCSEVLTVDGPRPLAESRDAILEELQQYQSRAMRTLGVAFRRGVGGGDGAPLEQAATELTWLGFAAIADPVRSEVPAAIDACRRAGIDVKIVTGDNPGTASEIGRSIGLLAAGGEHASAHLLGHDFSELDEAEANRAVTPLKILSRAKPIDKMRLVRVLQRQGHVVAVTGDGTNDAPALNYADVGLAMGKTGTAIAKQASDIVLLDDSFQSIVNAVMWGRSLYENIQRFILFQLTINVAALGIAFIGPFIGVKLPLTVTQMLWINLIMDTFAALALATEPPHASVMLRPPRRPDAFIISPAMTRSILGTGLCFLVLLVGFLVYLRQDGMVDRTELSVFFSAFVMLQFWNLFNARALGRTSSSLAGVFDNKAFLGIALAIVIGQIAIVQFGGAAFRTEPLSWRTWAVIILATSPVLLIGETWRWLGRRRDPA